MTDSKLRWGIFGPGNIAHKLADAVLHDSNSELAAIASKSAERAQAFADRYNIDACTSYESLVERSDIDIVYVATTHNFHYENAKLALDHGKHVLIEKPFTVNALEAKKLVELATHKGLFLMEAVWVRYLPSMIRLKEILASGIIGEIKLFTISFGRVASPDYIERLTQPALAGGVTLDMGIYPITFVNYLLDELPTNSKGMCRLANTGVDELATYSFQYPSGCLATMNTSFALLTKFEAMIYGSKGYIEFPEFQQGTQFTIHVHNGTRTIESQETVTVEQHQNGFVYQVAEVAKKIRAGKLESEIMPLSETIATMELMDNLRKDWGLTYPFE